MPKNIEFRSLKECLVDLGEPVISDFAKFDRPIQLHVGFQALHQFEEEKGRLPKPKCQEDADEFLALCTKVVETLKKGKGVYGGIKGQLLTQMHWFYFCGIFARKRTSFLMNKTIVFFNRFGPGRVEQGRPHPPRISSHWRLMSHAGCYW